MPPRLAVQQALLPGSTVGEQFAHAAAYGFTGVELNHNDRFDIRRQIDVIVAARDSTGIDIAAICTTAQQDPVVADHAERNRRITEMVVLVDAASTLGARGVISVPLRRSTGFDDAQLPELALDIYGRIARHLDPGDASIFLEPLNRYEATFLNRVGQAALLARMVEHPRVRALADLYHMNIEETSFATPIEEAGSLLGHVHLADNTRDEPGAGMIDFAPAFGALRRI
ncbi:MAG: sugar phosphate isomerase/epimerase, partial [Chloroflexota bacterium]|nr:sugar phosphate isomerase/epimerase [Chloroflexota bacterium]